jgi:rsbT co-antagonist protein RsbR
MLADVAAGIYDLTFDITADDEIGDLEGALNEVVQSVKVASQLLTEQHELLETRVRERTAHLSRELEERQRSHELIEKQRAAIMELSTPVLEVWQGVLVLPVVGIVDAPRGQQIIEQLLQAIVAKQARVAIIDVTGVAVFDTVAARHLLGTIQAMGLLGTQAILTGVGPENAKTMVALGIDLGQVETRSSLKTGLQAAFDMLSAPALVSHREATD